MRALYKSFFNDELTSSMTFGLNESIDAVRFSGLKSMDTVRFSCFSGIFYLAKFLSCVIPPKVYPDSLICDSLINLPLPFRLFFKIDVLRSVLFCDAAEAWFANHPLNVPPAPKILC